MKCCDTVLGAVFSAIHIVVTYQQPPKANRLQYTRLERLDKDKHSNLIHQLVSCEENEVL
jgi:hypothetical protein